MVKYRIMIIDDEFKTGTKSRRDTINRYFSNSWIRDNDNIKKREDILKLLSTEFELIFASTWDEFLSEFENCDIDAFCIDYLLFDAKKVLESGDFNEKSMNHILYKIKEKNKNMPIIIYSSGWTGERISTLLDDFKNVFGNRVPSRIMTYNDFAEIVEDLRLNEDCIKEVKIRNLAKERKRMWDMIAESKGQVSFQPYSNSGDITILHISDLQFGDKKTSGNIMGMWNDMHRAIDNYLKSNDLDKIDLIILTGDIAMYGKKEEYKEALTELPRLFERIWGKHYSAERIIVVPGNHDYDINACVLEYFKAQNVDGERKVDFDLVVNQIKEKKKFEEYSDLGLYEFRRFAYQLTKNDQYILSNSLNFIVNSFKNWGLQFLCLNTMDGVNAQKTNHVGINCNELEAITNTIDSDSDLLTIVLAHHTLLSEEILSDEEKEKLKKRYDTIQRSMGAKIVMGGHRHVNETKSKSNSAHKIMETIESASLRIEEDEEKYARGFGVIIIKEDFSKLHVQYFDFNKGDGEIQLGMSKDHSL